MATRTTLFAAARSLASDRFAGPASFLILNQGIVCSLGFAYWLLAARSYSLAEVGKATAEIGIGILLGTIGTLGLPAALTRALPISADPPRLVIRVLCFTAVLGFFIGVCGVSAISAVFPSFYYLRVDGTRLASLVLFVVAYSLLLPIEQVLIAARSAVLTTVMFAIFALLRLGGALLVFGNEPRDMVGVWGGALSMAIVIMIGVFLPRAVRRLVPLPGGQGPSLRSLLTFAIGNHLGTLLALAGPLLLPAAIMVGLEGQVGEKAAGVFYVCFQIATLIYVVPVAISSVHFAEGSRPGRNIDNDERRAILLTLGIIAPAILVVGAFAQYVVGVFGAAYAESGSSLLRVLALASVAVAFGTILATRFRIAGALRPVVLASTVSTVIALAGTFGLAPRFGALGAGIAFAIGQLMGAAVLFFAGLGGAKAVMVKQ